MSGGQQQRICIARALAANPEVLLMDEPTSALDPISTAKIEDLVLELKKDYTIVMVTHNMQQATRVSDTTAFFLLGDMIEADDTEKLFSMPQDKLLSADSHPLTAGAISIDERAHTVCVSGRDVQLTLKEYQLLVLLMKNQGAVLTRDVLLENIWGYGSESETRTVDVHIRTLRQKLGDSGALIETVRGVGYRMGASG